MTPTCIFLLTHGTYFWSKPLVAVLDPALMGLAAATREGRRGYEVTRLRREGPLLATNERNRLAAQLKAKREGNQAGWTPEEVADMEEGDDEFKKWEDALERLKALIGP